MDHLQLGHHVLSSSYCLPCLERVELGKVQRRAARVFRVVGQLLCQARLTRTVQKGSEKWCRCSLFCMCKKQALKETWQITGPRQIEGGGFPYSWAVGLPSTGHRRYARLLRVWGTAVQLPEKEIHGGFVSTLKMSHLGCCITREG